MKAANSSYNEDPKWWEFIAIDAEGKKWPRHREETGARKWENRFQWRDWNVDTAWATDKFILRINATHSDEQSCRLDSIRLFKVTRE